MSHGQPPAAGYHNQFTLLQEINAKIEIQKELSWEENLVITQEHLINPFHT